MVAPRLRYRVSVPAPESHLAEIELRVAGAGPSFVAKMAAWCPGSYLVRDYARFVRDLVATDGGGKAIPVEKIDKQSFRVDAGDASEVILQYRVYGHELSVRTNHIDDGHAFLHGPATFLYLPEHRDVAAAVEIEAPAGRDWHVVTALRPEGRGFVAADTDELFDCPIHMGPGEPHRFHAADSSFRLALFGMPQRSRFSVDDLLRDLASIVEQHAVRFGGVPFDDYTFILMLSPGAYGGLEHKSSSANLTTPLALESAESYQDLLELLSHEFFHVWNGKRIFPATLSPFDYDAEQYTRCLWVMEGITSYVDRMTVRAAKRIPVSRYFTKLCDEYARLAANPGRLRHSLEDSSFDAWIKLYKPDESNLNTTVSYYLKGGLVILALDLELRHRAGKGIEHVLRHLWETYGRVGTGYPEDVQADFEAATGVELGAFFDAHVRSPGELDLAPFLEHAGLVLEEASEPGEQGTMPSVWLGAHVRDGTTVAAVIDGGPGGAVGLSPGDEIVAVDGTRVRSDADLRRILGARAPGDAVELAIFRRDALVALPVILAATPPTRYRVRGAGDLSAEQRALFEGWMGEPHPGPGETLATGSAASWL